MPQDAVSRRPQAWAFSEFAAPGPQAALQTWGCWAQLHAWQRPGHRWKQSSSENYSSRALFVGSCWPCFGRGGASRLSLLCVLAHLRGLREPGLCWLVSGRTVLLCCSSVTLVRLFVTLGTAARRASLSFSISRSLLNLMSVESMLPSNHLILCRPLLLLSSIFASIRVFSSELALHISWPKYWSFSFSISPSSEYQSRYPLGWTGWISLLSKGFSVSLPQLAPGWFSPGRVSRCGFRLRLP